MTLSSPKRAAVFAEVLSQWAIAFLGTKWSRQAISAMSS